MEAVHVEYAFHVQRNDERADDVADQLVTFGEPDPRTDAGRWGTPPASQVTAASPRPPA